MPGRCYRLMDEKEFLRLEAHRPREIDRVPIHREVLMLIDAGVSALSVLQISELRLNQALLLLFDMKLVKLNDDKFALNDPNRRYVVTDDGQFIATLAIGIHSAYMILLAYNDLLAANKEKNLSKSKPFSSIACRVD